MDNPLLWQMILQVVLIGANAFFACAEIAVISLNDNKLAQMARQGDKRAICLTKLTEQPARFLATIQVAITLSGFLGSAFAADSFSDPLVRWLIGIGVPIPAATLDAISVILITLILSYFTLVFGELVPKRLAMKKAEQLALSMARFLSLVAKLTAPIVWVLTASTNGILRLCGVDPSAEEEEVSEEEIRMMVDIGSEKGVIDGAEKEMIQNVFEFDDTTVGELATHRTELAKLWLDDPIERWDEIIHETRYSRYLICGETIDHVVGVLNAKDYFRVKEKTKDAILETAVRPPHFVPESVCADVLFAQMKQTRNRMAVVLDEYGGMVGIVTMNDLIERLVGDLENDDCEQPPEIERASETAWEIRGAAPLDEVQKALGVALPVKDYDTFGGFVLGCYGFVPEDGAGFELSAYGLHIKVPEVREHRIGMAQVALVS